MKKYKKYVVGKISRDLKGEESCVHFSIPVEEAKEGATVIKVKYSDTDAMFDKQVKNALREFGIPEDVIQQQNFKYG